jgi:glycosyltransferase involved in cell wall biosynthesis
MDILNKINEQGISIIIGARNEYPQIVMTITNLMEDMRASGINKYEIILMDNGSIDETSRFFAWKPEEKGVRWKYIYSPRGMVAEGRLRIFFDPVCSNVGTRNKGVEKAKYQNIIFSDAHIIVRPGSIKEVVGTLIQFGGIVHAPIAWMGASPENPDPGYQYSYKVGEKIWGTWNKIQVESDKPFYIPLCGHAFMAVKKEEFIRFKGYPLAQRVYGGGEPYLDTKYWMLGSTSMMEPRALAYHLSAGRGYNWHSDDLLHNMLLVSYILGDQRWLDRIMITYLNKSGVNKYYLYALEEEIKLEAKEDKEWLDDNKKFTFEQVLGLDHEEEIRKNTLITHDNPDWYCKRCTKRNFVEEHVLRPWDIKNDELYGHHRSYVQEFALHEKDEQIYIGNTPITDPEAIERAKKYL